MVGAFFYDDCIGAPAGCIPHTDRVSVTYNGGPANNGSHAAVSSNDANYVAFISIADKDRKSTRLNSSHQIISYAVFCLKKKMKIWATLPLINLTILAMFLLLHFRSSLLASFLVVMR